ncbi:glycoside hydrolase [Flammeovirga yaeyamensis]|nr:glycoside hydrolase [Flammeovirga yaeyamensis]
MCDYIKYYIRIFITLTLFTKTIALPAQNDKSITLQILDNEYWWGGLSSLGHQMPYSKATKLKIDLWGNNRGNQAQPLLISNKGRYIWSESPIQYEFHEGKINVKVREGNIYTGKEGDDLNSVYQYVSQRFFPSNGSIPDEILFTHPQYNTWIELTYHQNEKDILKYAQSIIDNGYPPGVLMIDDNWQEDYGNWNFSSRRFKDPKGLIDRLHLMGFKVMLWVCPFVSPDSEIFRQLAEDGLLILDPQKKQEILWANTKNKAAAIRWWNGFSACLDLSNPKAEAWMHQQLENLVENYSIDGFKFDAGDARFYKNNVVSYQEVSPNDHTTFFAKLGLNFPLNEYRASWKMAGLPLVQRLRDKRHSWEDLQKLIGDQLSQSAMGYAYTCPDMIGGGEYQSFKKIENIDQELIVRSAQVHALMPMMQFSVSPWRVLSDKNNQLCLEAAKLHQQMGAKMVMLAKRASKTGIPIVRPMEMVFPNAGYENIKDQFVLGDDVIVAPIIKKGQRKRKVILPKGKWMDEKGEKYNGEATIEIEVPLERLPYFSKIK